MHPELLGPEEWAEKIAEELIDTPGFLAGALAHHGATEMLHRLAFMERLEALAFECDECGWWSKAGEECECMADDDGDWDE